MRRRAASFGTHQAVRGVVCALLLGATCLGGAPVRAGPRAVQIRVEGSSRIQAAAAAEPAGTTVQGQLTDEAGRPIAGADLELSEQAPSTATPLKARSCPLGQPASRVACAGPKCRVTSDAQGRFCAVLELHRNTGTLALEYADPSTFFSGTTALVALDQVKRSLELHLSVPAVLDLERERHRVRVDAQASPTFSAGERRTALQIELLLRRLDNEERLETVSVYPGESSELELRSLDLGGPGPAELIARFAGSDAVSPVTRSVQVLVTARALLAVAGPPATGDPEDGIPLRVAVGSAAGAVPSGTVEARVEGHTVGTAEVASGTADLVLRLGSQRPGRLECTLQYLPSAPWWRPGPGVPATIELTGPSPWRRLPWLIAAAGLAAWTLSLWRRPERTRPPRPGTDAPPERRPGVELVESAAGAVGWTGVVLDVHEGTPIADALVQVIVPALQGSGVVQAVRTDRSGGFELKPLARPLPEGARLNIGSRWHSPLDRVLPREGALRVGMILRRRALLERLIEWAHFASAPFSQWTNPTPGLIKREAVGRGAKDVAQWAAAVEEAAYGPDPVNESTEERVCALEPGWGAARASRAREP